MTIIHPIGLQGAKIHLTPCSCKNILRKVANDTNKATKNDCSRKILSPKVKVYSAKRLIRL